MFTSRKECSSLAAAQAGRKNQKRSPRNFLLPGAGEPRKMASVFRESNRSWCFFLPRVAAMPCGHFRSSPHPETLAPPAAGKLCGRRLVEFDQAQTQVRQRIAVQMLLALPEGLLKKDPRPADASPWER